MAFPSSRGLRWLLMAAAASVSAIALLIADPSGALLFRGIGLAGMVLFALSVAIMLLTFRKARRLSPWMLLTSATISVVCTATFFALAGAPLSRLMVVLATAVGAMVGIGWSLTNLLFVDGGSVRARGNLWYLAVWGLSLALTQVAALAGGRTPYAVAVVSFIGMGVAVGNSLGLVLRYARAQRLARAAAPVTAGAT